MDDPLVPKDLPPPPPLSPVEEEAVVALVMAGSPSLDLSLSAVPPPPASEAKAAKMGTLRNAFWDIVDEVRPEEPRAPPCSPPMARSAPGSRSVIAKASPAPVLAESPVVGSRKDKKAEAKTSRGARRRMSGLASRRRATIDRGPSKSSKGPSFPGVPVKQVVACVGCGRSQDQSAFLRCSQCKRDTCAQCTVLRSVDSKQRLACAQCGAKALKEAALKRKVLVVLPVSIYHLSL